MKGKYFRYLFKKYKAVLLFVLLITAGSAFFAGNVQVPYGTHYAAGEPVAFVLCNLLCFVLPVLMFHPLQRRNSADVYLALPMQRKDFFLVCFAFMLTVTSGIYAAVSGFLLLVSGHAGYGIGILYALVNSTAGFLVLLLVNSALFLIGNSVFDGVMMTAAYSLLPLAVSLALESFMFSMFAGTNWSVNIPWNCLSAFAMIITNGVGLASNTPVGADYHLLYLPILLIHALIAVMLLDKNGIRRKSERAESMSDEKEAYPAVIFLYATLCLLLAGSEIATSDPADGMWLAFMTFGAFIVGQFIYRRNIRITLKDVISFGICFTVTLGLSTVTYKTRGFGFAERDPILKNPVLVYSYNSFDDLNRNAEISFEVTVSSKDPQLKEMMEDYRRHCVDAFYSKKERVYTYHETNFHVHAADVNQKQTEERSYYGTAPFSKDELALIAEYTPGRVYLYETNETLTLKEYLARVR